MEVLYESEEEEMSAIDLTKYGISGTTEIVYNPSYEQLFEDETRKDAQYVLNYVLSGALKLLHPVLK